MGEIPSNTNHNLPLAALKQLPLSSLKTLRKKMEIKLSEQATPVEGQKVMNKPHFKIFLRLWVVFKVHLHMDLVVFQYIL